MSSDHHRRIVAQHMDTAGRWLTESTHTATASDETPLYAMLAANTQATMAAVHLLSAILDRLEQQ